MSISLILMMLVPIFGTAILFKVAPAAHKWHAIIVGLVGLVIVGCIFGASYGVAVHDIEVWNGKVLSKERKHDTYEEPYQCNCKTVTKSSGSGKDRREWTDTECETCYRTHYTVNWNCDTTIGKFKIAELDELHRSVYNAPDPARWLDIKKDDPVAGTRSYVNYVQAVKNSLFTASDEAALKTFNAITPAYPDRIYDFYKIDRFITPGFAFVDAPLWNEDISKMLIDLGPQKQVNVIVVIAKTNDRNYVSALRTKWEGANKNDVVVVIGTLDGAKIEFVDVITWSKNEIFKVELIDRLQDLRIVSREPVLSAVKDQIEKNFVRRRMREFEYLKGEIDVSLVVVGVTTIILVALNVAALAMFNGKFSRVSRRRSAW